GGRVGGAWRGGRRGGGAGVGRLEASPRGDLGPTRALERFPQRGPATRLSRSDHPPRILGPDAAAAVEGPIVAKVVFVIVAHEDETRAQGVAGDPIVGALERLPLLVRRRQVEAALAERRPWIDDDAGLAAFDVRRHRANAERIGREWNDLHA